MPASTPNNPDRPAHSAGHTSETPARGLLVLVAEDHEFQREMLVEMLEELGATGVYEVANGREALQVMREVERPFDIIITDIDMPGMDGLAFIRSLGEAKLRTSLIITSSLDRTLLDSVEEMSSAYGMRLLGTIAKPATTEQLADLIGRHWIPKGKPDQAKPPSQAFSLDDVLLGLSNAEFEPFFQPKLELASGRVKGAEALARWRHPSKGMVLPYAFIQLLEDSEQIAELTWIMLAKSAAHCREWRAAGLDLDVSVNISVTSLDDVSIADAITWQVLNQGLEPRHVTLEITESALMSKVGPVLENLARLRMKGFGLSIDDYGTGYSSMQQLTRIPFTELKIDQSFVMHAARQESSRLILESSLEMARKLRITSVAEGVETQEDWDLLRDGGCVLAQGYHIARPMAAELFPEWVRERG
ncbi:MAG: EAL domain-containing response regulator [Pseudomarimonas sp.]